MLNDTIYDVILIGGGLAGLTCANHLSESNLKILLIEKNKYPNHKVCGEYVSNEVLHYLKKLKINVFDAGAKKIDTLQLSTENGKKITSKLPLGGFGLSRYSFDDLLYNNVKNEIDFVFDSVTSISTVENISVVKTSANVRFEAKLIIGAFGKRSNIDLHLKRSFIENKSPWVAVKAHYKYDFKDNVVALHNFDGGYCGISKVEDNSVNACYLATYNSFKKCSGIAEFQQQTMSKNPHLKDFFKNAELVFEKPLAIGQISFEKKQLVENGVFMIGDSAGLIHPLCGNGMAMAIHSAKILSELILKNYKANQFNKESLEIKYSKKWKDTFSKRLKTGRQIQKILLNKNATKIGLKTAQVFPSIVTSIIKKTHGKQWIQ